MAPPKSSRRPKARTTTPPRRLPVVPIAVGVIAVIGVIAILVTALGGDDDPDVPEGVEQVRPVEIIGDPLTVLPRGEADPAIGATAPTIRGADFDGTPVTIGPDGRPKVLVFVAHWCPHCQAEVPVLADWLRANGVPDDVDIYAISTNATPDRPNYPPSVWLEKEGFDVPTLADDADNSGAAGYGLSFFPFFVALDGENQVVARTTGELTVAQWEALLDTVRPG